MFIYGHLRSTISIFSFFRFLALPGHPLIAGGRRRTVLEEGEAGGEGATVRAQDIPRWPRIRIGGGRIKNCTENSIYLSLFLYFSAVCASRPATRRPSAARVAAGTPLPCSSGTSTMRSWTKVGTDRKMKQTARSGTRSQWLRPHSRRLAVTFSQVVNLRIN